MKNHQWPSPTKRWYRHNTGLEKMRTKKRAFFPNAPAIRLCPIPSHSSKMNFHELQYDGCRESGLYALLQDNFTCLCHSLRRSCFYICFSQIASSFRELKEEAVVVWELKQHLSAPSRRRWTRTCGRTSSQGWRR